MSEAEIESSSSATAIIIKDVRGQALSRDITRSMSASPDTCQSKNHSQRTHTIIHCHYVSSMAVTTEGYEGDRAILGPILSAAALLLSLLLSA
ncbi:hypothetical protein MANES_14G037066v8 [Manihot esculenta]|uniref:Uncharacterized protein n=1 Tax=Manihot esculenta TaxID=3983 RepID=A0A2C9UIH4_MANES|nr:hypothetical protein MANES_14G037066v8 [Manihot esculenta]